MLTLFHVVHVDATKHLDVLGTKAERILDLLDGVHVVALLVVEMPDVLSIRLVSHPAQRANAVG